MFDVGKFFGLFLTIYWYSGILTNTPPYNVCCVRVEQGRKWVVKEFPICDENCAHCSNWVEFYILRQRGIGYIKCYIKDTRYVHYDSESVQLKPADERSWNSHPRCHFSHYTHEFPILTEQSRNATHWSKKSHVVLLFIIMSLIKESENSRGKSDEVFCSSPGDPRHRSRIWNERQISSRVIFPSVSVLSSRDLCHRGPMSTKRDQHPNVQSQWIYLEETCQLCASKLREIWDLDTDRGISQEGSSL